MERLPIEIFRCLLSFLNVDSLIVATKVCKHWHKEIEYKRQWESRLHRMRIAYDDYCSACELKHQVVERMRIIRAFRRFVEHPKGPEFCFISNILFPPWNVDIPSLVAKAMNIGEDTIDLAERYIGLRPACSILSLDAWRSLLMMAWKDMRCEYSMRSFTEGGLMMVHGNLCIRKISVVGYVLWKALREEWGQTDIRADPGYWEVGRQGSFLTESMTLEHVLLPFQMVAIGGDPLRVLHRGTHEISPKVWI